MSIVVTNVSVARSRDSFDRRQESLNPTPLLKMNFDKISLERRPAENKESEKLKENAVVPPKKALFSINTEKSRNESVGMGTEF